MQAVSEILLADYFGKMFFPSRVSHRELYVSFNEIPASAGMTFRIENTQSPLCETLLAKMTKESIGSRQSGICGMRSETDSIHRHESSCGRLATE